MFKFNPLTGKFDLVGDSSPSVFQKEVLTVPPAEARATTAVDAAFTKYFVLCEGDGKTLSFEINVLKHGAGTLETVSHKVGQIGVEVTSTLNGLGQPRIEFINNELVDINVTVLYSNS